MIKSLYQQQEIKICPHCKKEFVDDKLVGAPATYCTRRCAQKAWYKRKNDSK